MKGQTIRALEYAVRMLKKEWEKSGEIKKVLEADTTEIHSMLAAINSDIKNCSEAVAGGEEIPFRESIAQSKRNYILLRIGRKLMKAVEKRRRKGQSFPRLNWIKRKQNCWKRLWKNRSKAVCQKCWR